MRRTTTLPLGALVLLLVVAACSRGKVNDGGRYCALLGEQLPVLESPIASELDIAPHVSTYVLLRDNAPLDVEEDWQEMIDLANAAAEVDLTDQGAVVDVQAQAFSTAEAAEAIVGHAARLCGLTLPAVGQLPAPDVTISVPEVTVAETTIAPG